MKRLEGESFEGYKLRRETANTALKLYLKGQYIWENGTYTKAKHGKIGYAP